MKKFIPIVLVLLAVFAVHAPAQQVNIGIDCYLAVFDTPSLASCGGFNTYGCSLAIPSTHGSGYISLAVHGQPGATFYYAINTTGLNYWWTYGCWGIWDMDMTGAYIGQYIFPSGCTTGFGGSCVTTIPIYPYEEGDSWSFVVQGLLVGDAIYYPWPACGSCATMATLCHSP